MALKKCVAIVNPQGGSRQGLSVLNELGELLSKAGVSLDSQPTQYPGHAIELCRDLSLDDYDCLCVIGGDGTVHDVVGGLMLRQQRPKLPICLVPAGTGNTLHQDLNCSTVASSGKAILTAQSRWLDVVEVKSTDRTTYCVNIVGWGAIATINQKAEKLRMLGGRRYAVAALLEIAWPRPRYAKITLDNEVIEGDFQFVIACVTKTTGKQMLMAPNAQIDDGRVDVVILRKATRSQMIKFFQRVFDGSHLQLPFVESRQVCKLRIEAAASPLNLDGEVEGVSPFDAEVIPQALRVLWNPADSVSID
ncbi:MAG: diacylglycerol kinase family lipid kinase [Pirellulaceae bacterium]|nr:diacylglycerol kinase family lipid kinase [Pirellulaceae bacterium]